jgi:hypothetical protein
MKRRSRAETRRRGEPWGSGAIAGTASLQRKCACGASAGLTGECGKCSGTPAGAQRTLADENRQAPAMTEVLNSPGKPLDATTRASMESHLGHDFRNVRVHSDEQAAASARSINASAYTVGEDIVFGPGKYDPQSAEGKKRLAHELAHVVQQTAVAGHGRQVSIESESEARRVGDAVASGQAAQINTSVAAGTVQRDDDKNPLDTNAKTIIALAKGDKPAAERAVAIVKAIVDQYYAADKPLVDSVVYDNTKAGTGVRAVEKFAPSSKNEESTGTIYVGDSFLSGVDDAHFSRRVLQVGHEIEHIHQWREGLAGGQKSNEREFLAFYHEALLPEKPGTGRMQHSTRLSLIDEALKNYYCLAAKEQTTHESKKKELLDRRASEITAGGTASTADPPTECKKK